MKMFKQAILAILVCLLVNTLIVSAVTASNQSNATITVSSKSSTVVPGQSVSIAVGLSGSNVELQSAKISLSYDENLFTTDGAIRFDGELGKYVWRQDMYYSSNKYASYSTDDYTIDQLYPMDSNPFDGKQEVELLISANKGKTIKPSSDNLVTFALIAKSGTTKNQTSIRVTTDHTVLTSAKGIKVTNYTTSAANIHITYPKSIDIVQGTLDSTVDPFQVLTGNGYELNARAFFENGDTSYVTEIANWESSDTSVLTVPGYGSIKTVGVGTASVIVKLGPVTSKHTVMVLPKSKAGQVNSNVVDGYGCACKNLPKRVPPTKIVINGQLVGVGLNFEGRTYIPLRIIAESLGMAASYNKEKKAPTINGKLVKAYIEKSGVTYIQLKEIKSSFEVVVFFDNVNKRVYIDN